MYKGKKDFKNYKKDKGKKSCFIAQDFDDSEDEMVYIVVKDEFDDERDKMALICHVRKNDIWIIDSDLSHHMTGDKPKFEHIEYYDRDSVRFGNNKSCNIKVKGCISLTIELICDNVYRFE